MHHIFIPILIGSSLLLAQEKEKPAPAKDVPKVLYSIPLVVEQGKKLKVMLRGAKLEGVTEVKHGDTKMKITGPAKKSAPPGNYPAAKFGDSECEVELELPKDFADKNVELVAIAPGGESRYTLHVAQGSVREKEPNNGFAEAQEVKLPVLVDGVIGQERDVDLFRFVGKAGQMVNAEIFAARLGSPADLNITLYDSTKNILAQCDDTSESSDPAISFTLPRDGVYYLGVQESSDLGGTQYGYRLQLK
jgi:predicted Rdx family selenoprotein